LENQLNNEISLQNIIYHNSLKKKAINV